MTTYPPDAAADIDVETGSSGASSPDSPGAAATPFFGEQPDFADGVVVRGAIVSPSGHLPIAGAVVSVDVGADRAWMLTGPRGEFALTLPPGSATLSVEKGRYRVSGTFVIEPNRAVNLGDVALDAGDVRVAVVHGEYDAVNLLLDALGIGFDAFPHPEELFGSPDVLANYAMVFANCGSEISSDGREEYSEEMFANVRSWVAAGGTLYVSDLEWALFEGVAPEALEFADDPAIGEPVILTAEVLDRDIERLLGGPYVDIRFDLGGWAMIDAVGEALPIVVADVPGFGLHPLAALHHLDEGRMIFTSFHNEQQVTSDMELILYEVILSL